jgi:hypothetical protein
MEEIRNAYESLVGKLEGKKPLGIPRTKIGLLEKKSWKLRLRTAIGGGILFLRQ